MTQLKDILTKSEEQIELKPECRYRQVTVKLWGKGVVLRNEVPGSEIAASKRYILHYQEFIVSRIDARNGAFGLIPDSLDEAVVSSDFPVFKLDLTRIYPGFLEWMCRTNQFIDFCKTASEGTTNRVRLKEDRFLASEISLPPLDEQRRIVARIEELAAWIKEARELRRGAMQEAAAISRSYYKKLFNNILVDGHLKDILLRKPRNGWSAKCDNDENGIPVLTLSAVTGFKYRANEIKRTSEKTSAEGDYWLKPGDLLITRSNTPDLVGHAAIYTGSPAPCIYPDLMMRLEVDERKASKEFVHTWLKSPAARQYLQKVAKGSSPTMKKINQQSVMEIPFPSQLSIQDQLQVVAKQCGLEAKLDTLRRHQAETAAALDALLPAVLERAFRGEL